MFKLSRSNRVGKKWQIVDTLRNKTVHFGATGYSDYTLHHDPERMARYIARHKARENWYKTGIHTAGFWSRWLLWNKPSLQASIKDTEKRFNIKIVRENC